MVIFIRASIISGVERAESDVGETKSKREGSEGLARYWQKTGGYIYIASQHLIHEFPLVHSAHGALKTPGPTTTTSPV